MALTIKDIARMAGVSHSTVSRSLNNSDLIPIETRRRIQKIARESDFVFNANARSLSRGQTGCIALIYPEYFERYSLNLFFNSLQSTIRTVLEREKLDLLVSFPRNGLNGESNIEKLASGRKVDGMIIVNNEMDDEDLRALKRAEIPFVFLHKHPADSQVPDEDYFCTDHVMGGRLAAERLIEIGRRRLFCVSTQGEEFVARTGGFMDGVRDAGMEPDSVTLLDGESTFEFGERVIAPLILEKGRKLVDGVFCQTDLMAMGVIQGLQKAGLRVPYDVSVIGYDDIELASYFHPTLTTIHQPIKEITELACERLSTLLSSEEKTPPQHYLISPVLIVRES